MTTNDTTARPAGHALIEALVAQGVDTVFGVPGESFLAALDGFFTNTPRRIRFVACRHEGGAAFMAEAHGKLTGRPGVCFVTRGPGRDQCQRSACTSAFQDSTPLVLLVGQVASDQRDREAFQEIDYRQMFGPGTLGLGEMGRRGAVDPDRLPRVRRRAPSAPRCRAGRGRWCSRCRKDMLRATLTSAPTVLPRVDAGAGGYPDPHAAGCSSARAPDHARSGPIVDRRRQRLDGQSLCRPGALRRALAAAGRLRLPLPGHLRQPPSELRRRRRHRHQSQAGARASPRATSSSPSAPAWAR